MKKENTRGGEGRTKIDSRERLNSFSKRALEGKIEVYKNLNNKCIYCGHRKFIRNTYNNKSKCTKCKQCVK